MKEDFNALRLKHHGDTAMMFDILQRECRYKCSSKLHETLKCETFIFPSLAVAEMATSDDAAKIHASMIDDGENVLDMTCGLGIDTFHISRKADKVTSIELNHDAYTAAIHNVKALGLNNVEIIEGDSVEWLKAKDIKYDTIFIDPARRDSTGRHFALKDCRPDIIENIELLLCHCKKLIIKASPMIDITKACKELPAICKTVVIGTVKECKEVMFICKGEIGKSSEEGNCNRVSSITIGKERFSFSHSDEQNITPRYITEDIIPGAWIYEPYPSVMKGGGFNSLSQQFNLGRLYTNTNLFYSTKPQPGFPGKTFEIIEILHFDKQSIKEFAKRYPKINVATRNFPLSAPELAQKLKVEEGGDKMVFGAIGPKGKKSLIVTSMGQ